MCANRPHGLTRRGVLAGATTLPLVLAMGNPASANPFDALRRPLDQAVSSGRVPGLVALIARGIYMARRGFMTLSLPQTPEDDDALVAAFADVLRTHARVLRDHAAARTDA